jgi:hypothetical protein
MPASIRQFSAIACIFAAVTALAAPELVVNGSFEEMVHNMPAGWTRTDDEANRVIATWSIDDGPASAHAVKIECSSFPAVADAVPSSRADLFQGGMIIESGQKYLLSFHAKGRGIASRAFSVRICDTNAGSLSTFAASIPLTDQWREYRFEFTAATNIPSKSSRLWFTLDSTGTIWLDDVSLSGGKRQNGTGSRPPKFEPRLSKAAGKNLVPNGSFECGADGWLSLGQSVVSGGSVAGLYGSVETGPAFDGVRAYRLSLGSGATPESFYDFWEPQHVLQRRLLVANRGWIDVKAGHTYTLSAYMRSDQPRATGILQFNFNGDARKPVQALSREVALTEKWQRYAYTVLAPEDGVYVSVGTDVSKVTATVATTFWADAVQLESGEKVTSFEPREPVEMGFNSGRYGNIFSAGTPVVIDLSAHNSAQVQADFSVEAQFTDYWNRVFTSRTLRFMIPTGKNVEQALALDLPPGFYDAHFSWEIDGRVHSETMPLAVIEPYTLGDSPFGLNHAPTTSEACRQIRQAGITWVRDWSVNWEWAEPKRGKLSFAKMDPIISRIRREGMHVLALLPANPSTNWDSTAPDSVPNDVWYRMAYAPKDPQLLFAFASKAATHYKGSVAYWEFLNEPLWVPDFCLPKKGGYTVDSYISLLKGASAAIRSANHDAKIIGGLAIQAEMTLGDEFIKAGGLDYVDILNLHPYASKRAPESFVPNMKRIHEVMNDSGAHKPIWATETAYWGVDEFPFLPWLPPVENFAANRLLNSEQQAGDYVVRFSTIMFAHGVEKIFWHMPVAGDPNDALADMGNVFIGPGGLPRKSYVAISAFANVLGPAPVFAAKWELPEEISGRSTHNVWGYAFANGAKSLLVAWATGPDESEAWALRLPAEAKALNIAGAPMDGHRVPLTQSPIYITSTGLKASDLARQCILTIR